jgi:uncharacterized protein (TIRG00374 family)
MVDETEKASRRKLWLLLRYLGSVVLIVVIFWKVLPQVADFSQVAATIGDMTWIELTILTALAVWNILTYTFVWVTSLPGLRYPQAGVVSTATNRVASTVPGGGAIAIGLTYTILGSWGFSRSRTTISVLVTGIWNNFVKLGMPIFALAMLALMGRPGGGRMVVGVTGLAGLIGAIVVFALILRSEDFAARAGIRAGKLVNPIRRLFRMSRAEGWDLATVKFRNRTIGLLEDAWLKLTVATLVSHLSLYLVLLVALRDVGVSDDEVSWVEVLVVFSFARIVTAIPLTPGGIGVIELALTAGLVSAGGNEEQVVAAILVYRALTYVLPIPLGVVTYLFWQRNRSWRKEVVPETPPVEPAPA